jgi:hypothetical protein
VEGYTLPREAEIGNVQQRSILLEHFRCPEHLLELKNHDEPSSAVYLDASGRDCACDGLSLCTDLSHVIDNLRLEHYLQSRTRHRIARNIYYLFRPILPASTRNLIHRTVFQQRCKEFPKWPLDCSVETILESSMRRAIRASGLSEVPFIWFWPDGHDAALMMTHDIEEEAGAAQCRALMDVDDSFSVPASFQVIPEGRYGGVEELIAQIRDRGCEVNLHDLDHDGRLYQDLRQFEERADKINVYAQRYGTKGFRAGSMHRNQDWFHLLKIEYDMSVPNVAHLEPQAGGCCTVMPYFVGGVLELPLTTVQDHSLFYILKAQSIDLWKQQIEIICSHHGLITFIVHPDYIVHERERRIYCELLQHISKLRSERSIWAALPGDVNTWWRQRAQMRLVQTPAGWKVEGEGSERARVAYAQVFDGRLGYRIDRQAN